MSRNIPTIEREVADRALQISSPQIEGDLVAASTAVSDAFQRQTQQVNVQLAREAGERQALEGSAPRFIPGIGQADQAYKDAVSRTEGRMIAQDFRRNAMNAYRVITDPRNFTADSPQAFAEQLNEYRSIAISQARESNIGMVDEQITGIQDSLQGRMFDDALRYDNKLLEDDFHSQVDELKSEIRNSTVYGDVESAMHYQDMLNETLNDFSELSENIKRQVPSIRSEIQSAQKVNNVIAEYVDAFSKDQEAEFLAKFAQGRDDLDFDEWIDAAQTLNKIQSVENSLQHDANSAQYRAVEYGIERGEIISPSQIASTELLKADQKLSLMTKLERFQRQQLNASSELANDRRLFSLGRGAAVPDSRLKEYFNNSISMIEESQDSYATFGQMAEAILGEGPAPVSGIHGVPINTNVSTFDNLIEAALTSRDPNQIVDATLAYNKVQNASPNSIQLGGQALSMAVKGSNLIIGTNQSPDMVAEQVTRTVLDAKQPERQARSDSFRRSIQPNLPKYFDQVFGTKPNDFKTDKAFGVFREAMQNAYMNSNSLEDALSEVKKVMNSYGTSMYGERGEVFQHPIEKEFSNLYNLSPNGQALTNQGTVKLQGIIDRNPRVKWRFENNNIDLRTLTDEDKVLKSLNPISNRYLIEVDGHPTEAVITESVNTPLTQEGTFTYPWMYKDKWGQWQLLPDEGSPLGYGVWIAEDLSQYAPDFAAEMNEKELDQRAKSVKAAQISGMLESYAQDNSIAKLLPTKMLGKIAVESLLSDEELDLDSIKDALRGRKGNQATRVLNQIDKVQDEIQNTKVLGQALAGKSKPKILDIDIEQIGRPGFLEDEED